MIYLAIGSDLDENMRPFWFLKPGQSIEIIRRMKELRMVLLKAWNCYWLESDPDGGRWEMLDQWLQRQLPATYAKGEKKFGGYTEAIGRFDTAEAALDFARELIAQADDQPREWYTVRHAPRPEWVPTAPAGKLG